MCLQKLTLIPISIRGQRDRGEQRRRDHTSAKVLVGASPGTELTDGGNRWVCAPCGHHRLAEIQNR
jgi:hypothetical protein